MRRCDDLTDEDRLTREQLLALAELQAQKGSVTAIKLLLEELRREDDGAGGSEFDDLDGPSNVTPIRKKSA